MNVISTCTSTTAVRCSVATSSSESLPNDGEKPNQPKKLLFLKYDYDGHKTFKCSFVRHSSVHSSILEGWSFQENWWIL